MYEKSYDSYIDVPINTLELKLKVGTLISQSLFLFKFNVLEHRANTTKHVSLP